MKVRATAEVDRLDERVVFSLMMEEKEILKKELEENQVKINDIFPIRTGWLNIEGVLRKITGDSRILHVCIFYAMRNRDDIESQLERTYFIEVGAVKETLYVEDILSKWEEEAKENNWQALVRLYVRWLKRVIKTYYKIVEENSIPEIYTAKTKVKLKDS